MDSEQVLLSDELLTVMRGAVKYAVDYGGDFVAPSHLLLALLDDAKIGDTLREPLERGRIIAAARQPAPAGIVEVPEGNIPRGESPPFVRYDSLAFQSLDGQHTRWLNRDTFRLFNESGKRVDGARFLPKHLAVGFANEAANDRDIRGLLGKDPETFKNVAYAL
jgi:hypothetical protein